MRSLSLVVAAALLQCVLSHVVELGSSNYTNYLKESGPDAKIVMEYYAGWCPHCKKFAPTYEKVGSHFSDMPSPEVVLARIDCAKHGDTCSSMNIHLYPTMMFGTAQQFLAAEVLVSDQEKLYLPEAENTKNATAIIKDIERYFGLSISLGSEEEKPPAKKAGVDDLMKAAQGVLKTAELGAEDDEDDVHDPKDIVPDFLKKAASDGTEDTDHHDDAHVQEDHPGEDDHHDDEDHHDEDHHDDDRNEEGDHPEHPDDGEDGHAEDDHGHEDYEHDDIEDDHDEDEEEDDYTAPKADIRDIIAATVQTYHEVTGADGALHSQRGAFIVFWRLVMHAHPVQECRHGASEMLERLPEWWPKGAGDAEHHWTAPKEMQDFEICEGRHEGAETGPQVYHACKGSTEDSRGYTCGLWQLLHSLSVGVPEDQGGKHFMKGLRAFIENFFMCQECRDNFLEQLNAPQTAGVSTRDEGIEWLWTTHNKVNARLAAEELQQGIGDPAFPKVDFPTPRLCPTCKGLNGRWDIAVTLKFLRHFYGREHAHHDDDPPDRDDHDDNGDTGGHHDDDQQHADDEDQHVEAGGDQGSRDDASDDAGGHAGSDGSDDADSDDEEAGVGAGGWGATEERQKVAGGSGRTDRWPGATGKGGKSEAAKQSGGWPWGRIMWLLGGWLALTLCCRCRWKRRRSGGPGMRGHGPGYSSLHSVL